MSHPLKPVRSLEARYYTDPAIYAQEMEGLPRFWSFGVFILLGCDEGISITQEESPTSGPAG